MILKLRKYNEEKKEFFPQGIHKKLIKSGHYFLDYKLPKLANKSNDDE